MIDACLTTPALVAAVASAVVALLSSFSSAFEWVGKMAGKAKEAAPLRIANVPHVAEPPADAIAQEDPRSRRSRRLKIFSAALLAFVLAGWFWWETKHVPYLVSVEIWQAGGGTTGVEMFDSEAFSVECGCILPDDRLDPAASWLGNWFADQHGQINVGIQEFGGEKNDIATSLKRLLKDSVDGSRIHIRRVEDIKLAFEANAPVAANNPHYQAQLERSLQIEVLVSGSFQRR